MALAGAATQRRDAAELEPARRSASSARGRAAGSCLRRLGRVPGRGLQAPALSARDLPEHFDWRNPFGNGSYVTGVRNQFLPEWCGSCWAQAVTSSLSDRLKILRIRAGMHIADIDLSPQPLLDCGIADDTKSVLAFPTPSW